MTLPERPLASRGGKKVDSLKYPDFVLYDFLMPESIYFLHFVFIF